MIAYTLILGLVGLFVFDYIWRLSKHIRIAQRSKLPYIVAPYSVSIISTAIFGPLLPYVVENLLPQWMGDVLYDHLGSYRWLIKDRQVKRYGKVYMLVSPKGVTVSVADASVVCQIVNARQDFPKPVFLYRKLFQNLFPSIICLGAHVVAGILDMYGPNVVTVSTSHYFLEE